MKTSREAAESSHTSEVEEAFHRGFRQGVNKYKDRFHMAIRERDKLRKDNKSLKWGARTFIQRVRERVSPEVFRAICEESSPRPRLRLRTSMFRARYPRSSVEEQVPSKDIVGGSTPPEGSSLFEVQK